MTVKQDFPVHEQLKVIRRHLHSIPELGLSEYETSKYIAAVLEEWGYKVTNGRSEEHTSEPVT